MAASTIRTAAYGWREISSTAHWTARCLWDTGTALYAVVQDSGATPKIRVMKADSRTAPTTWTEQDSANARTAYNGSYPFSSWLHTDGTLHVIAFSGAANLIHYRFNTATDLWTTGHGNITTGAETEHSVRCCVRSDGDVLAFFTSLADDADLGYFIWQGSNWLTGSVTGVLAATSTGASTILDAGIDSTDRAWVVYFDVAGPSVAYRTINSANTVATAVVLDSTLPGGGNQSSGARYNLYVDGSTDKIIAAYINATGGPIGERTITLESDANAANLTADAAVDLSGGTDTSARGVAATAVLGGVPYAAWQSPLSSVAIAYSTKSGASWAAKTYWKTGGPRLIEIVPVGTNALAGVYQVGTDILFDWIVAPAAPDTPVSASGSVNLDADETGSLAPIAATASDAPNLDADEAGSLAPITATATGSVNLDADESATVAVALTSTDSANLDADESGAAAAGDQSVSGSDAANLDADEISALAAALSGSAPINLDADEAGSLAFAPASAHSANLDTDELSSLAVASASAHSANIDSDEAGSLAFAPSSAHSANIDADEAGSLAAAASSAHSANLDADEASSVAVQQATADAALLTVTESAIVAIVDLKAASDAANVDADELSVLAAAPAGSDSINLDADESSSIAVTRTDAPNLDADEFGALAATAALSTPVLITVTESAITAIVDLKAASDAATVDSDELSTLASAQSSAHAANLDADESASVAVSVAGSDAALIDTDETGTSSVAHAATAPVTLTATEAGSVLIGLQEVFGVDAVALASTEARATAATLSGSDAANLDADETGTLAPLAVTASDAVTLTSAEAGSSAIDTLPVSGDDATNIDSIETGLVGTATLSASDPVSLDSDETGSPDASVAGSHAVAIQVGESSAVAQFYLIPADDAASLDSVEAASVQINDDPEPLPVPIHLIIATGAAPVGLSRHTTVPFTVVRMEPPAPALVRGTLASVQITRGAPLDRSLTRGSSPAPVMLPPTVTLSDPPAPALVRGSPWPVQIVRGTTSDHSVVLPITVVLLDPPSRALVRGAPGSLQIVRGADSDRALVRGSSSAPVVLRRGREE